MALLQVFLVQAFHVFQVTHEGELQGGGQHGYPVLGSFAIPDQDLLIGEVDVLDPQP